MIIFVCDMNKDQLRDALSEWTNVRLECGVFTEAVHLDLTGQGTRYQVSLMPQHILINQSTGTSLGWSSLY